MPELLTCTRKGCQKQYSKDENHQEACTFHSGAPIFHEGLKGWSCCEKRTVDFDEFMKIPGCCLGSHSNEKAVVPAAPKKDTEATNDVHTLKSTDVTSKTETYSTQPSVVSPLPQTSRGATPTIKEPEPEIILEDPEGLKVDVGTPCKRQSCQHSYVSEEVSRKGGSDSECTFHSGKPVFHEGSKGWSCCKRKVLEFDEFLKIKGCKKGNHLFGEQLNIVDCRKDWYQTATQIILSIFAKNTDKESCKISFTSQAIIVDLKFQNGKSLYQKTIDLFQEIVPEESTYKVMGTKVELTLQKANGISWPSLEPTQGPITSWTTFGRGDSPLTM